MSARGSKFLIGLFVIIGTLIFVSVVIWIGAADLFMKGSNYVTYFDESVQGLQADSTIKYRGVTIGKVESIKVAPDSRLIEVVMKIDLNGELQKNTVAQLKTAGITGIVFIELDQIKQGDVYRSPKLTFSSKYPVIPSRTSDISLFITDAGMVIQSLKEIDFKGISDQLKSTTKAIELFIGGKRLNNVMTNLESTSANLDSAIAKINKTIASGTVDAALKETVNTLSDARLLINAARKEIDALKLAEKAAKTGDYLEELDKKTKSIANNLQDTSEHLRTTSENLQRLSENLNTNPSELIYQQPAPPKKIME